MKFLNFLMMFILTEKIEMKKEKRKGFIDLLFEPFVFYFIFLGFSWLSFGYKFMIFMAIIFILTNLCVKN